MVDVLKLAPYRVLDPRLSQKQGWEFDINMGGTQVNYRRQSANSSSGNTSSITFNPVINTTSVVDRKMFVEVQFVLTFTGDSGAVDENLLKSGFDAPRSFGSIVANTQLSINTQSITQESRYVNHWLSRFEKQDDMKNYLSLAPYMSSPDRCQSYDEGVGTQFNSLGDFNSSNPNLINRGMYRVNVVSNTPTGAVVNLTLFDWIYLSPMVYDGSKLYPGIPNVSSLELQYTLQQIQRVWSHSNAGGSTISNLDVQINQAFLNFAELTPSPQVQIPQSVILPYEEIERRLTNTNIIILAGQTSTSLFSNTYTLNTIPQKCVIFAKERSADIQNLQSLITVPDVYGSIEKISIQYANQTALFNNCNAEQLYLISSRNGYEGSLEEWRGETQLYSNTEPNGVKKIGLSGSVFVFDFGRDVSISDPSLLPSVASNVNFQITELTVKNTSGRTINYDVEVFFLYQSTIEVSLGSARLYRSMVLPSEVMDYPIEEGQAVEATLAGGDFKGMIKKAMTGLKNSKVLKKGASALADAFLQPPERDLLRKYTGIGVSGSGVSGSGVSGSALVKKRNLRDRM